MRILIDLRCLQSPSPRGGVGVFAEQITCALLTQDRENEYLLFANGIADPRRRLPRFDFPNARWIVARWPNKIFNLLSLIPRPLSLVPHADVIFLPNLNFLPKLSGNTKLVVA
ncbi:MAG: hypothetical protein V1723_00820, partial [Candidatus Uhrbacteria bacterium]